jgi:hypothetical protein
MRSLIATRVPDACIAVSRGSAKVLLARRGCRGTPGGRLRPSRWSETSTRRRDAVDKGEWTGFKVVEEPTKTGQIRRVPLFGLGLARGSDAR